MNEKQRDRLEARLKDALGRRDAVAAPPFEDVFGEAGRRYRNRRRRLAAASGAAAAVVAVAAVVMLLVAAPEKDARYVEMEELMATTQWRAPSDSLLPRRKIDFYEDLPAMIESTRPAEGALL